jgi:hypothetical protein
VTIGRKVAAVSASIGVLGACVSFSSTAPQAGGVDGGEGGAALPTDAGEEGATTPSDGGGYPPGGDFEQNLDPAKQCGDWQTGNYAHGRLIQPGYQSNGACELCVGGGAPGLDIWMTPNTPISSPVEGVRYQAKAYLKLPDDAGVPDEAGAPPLAYLFFNTSLTPDPYPPPQTYRAAGDTPITSLWQLVDYTQLAANEPLLVPGLHILLPPNTCVDIDDFTVTVGP